MKSALTRRHVWKFALLFLVPMALYAFIAERNLWRPKTIIVMPGKSIYFVGFSPGSRYFIAQGCNSDSNVEAYALSLYDTATQRAILIPFDLNVDAPFLDNNHIIGWQKVNGKTRKVTVEISSLHGKIKWSPFPEEFYPIGKLHDGKTLIGYLRDTRGNLDQDELWTWKSDSRKAPQRYLHLNKKPKSKFYTEVSS